MIDLASPLQRLGIDEQIGQGVEPFHRALIAHAWVLNAQFFGLTIDAFSRGALTVNGAIQGRGAI
jgi:hypothetical protein